MLRQAPRSRCKGALPGRAYNGAMRPDLLDLLACPLCRGELTLAVAEEDGDDIVSGTLSCAACGEAFPIEDGIPNLLPPELREA